MAAMRKVGTVAHKVSVGGVGARDPARRRLTALENTQSKLNAAGPNNNAGVLQRKNRQAKVTETTSSLDEESVSSLDTVEKR